MIKAEKSIVIHVPVDKVFAFWQDPANQVEVWPSLVEVRDVQHRPGGGYIHTWVYKMAGMRLEGTTETVEFVPNQRFVEVSSGGIDSRLTWTFEPEGDGTKLTWEGEYTVPVPVLGKLAETLIVRMNDREADLILLNLKARMEASE
jgi:carbon monoxide dehydrogenase subunit G